MEVGVFEARNRFSELIDAAEKGEEIVVLRRGKPVVRMVPVADRELQTKVRRGQLSTEDRRRLLGRLEELPVLLHPATTTPELRAVAELCDRRGLTAYDAAYLALGLQLGAPLATLDARLAKAARDEGLAVHCPF